MQFSQSCIGVLEVQGDFALDLFTHQAIYNQTGTQIEMYLQCQKDHKFFLKKLDLGIVFSLEEKILTEVSRKFDVMAAQAMLASHGLHPIQVWTDPLSGVMIVFNRLIKVFLDFGKDFRFFRLSVKEYLMLLFHPSHNPWNAGSALVKKQRLLPNSQESQTSRSG